MRWHVQKWGRKPAAGWKILGILSIRETPPLVNPGKGFSRGIAMFFYGNEMKRIAEFKRAQTFRSSASIRGFFIGSFSALVRCFTLSSIWELGNFCILERKHFHAWFKRKIWLFPLRRSTPFKSRNTPCSQRNRVKHHHGCNQSTLSVWNGRRKSARTIWKSRNRSKPTILANQIYFLGRILTLRRGSENP